MIVTRFAPSPTGRLHLGHAASALFAYNLVQKEGGCFLLRIEDIDQGRCKPEYIEGIYEDLAWLGLHWEQPVRIQSEHYEDYQAALNILHGKGLLYPCFCTRKEIAAEIAQAGGAPHLQTDGSIGPVYPGTCRCLSPDQRAELMATKPYVWRLDMEKALEGVADLFWYDKAADKEVLARPQDWGDVVLARKDIPTSYHLSVTLDDSLQGVTVVTRGRDLYRATDIHRLLQYLLNFKTPLYFHHDLLTDPEGKRMAKRHESETILNFRSRGLFPAQLSDFIPKWACFRG